jgi:tRNA nucleotidyltransferase (CCA-adding enzyme)
MISPEVKEFAHVISSHLKGKLYLVGGAVRDMFIGIPPKDFDFELFHVWPTELVNFLDKNKIPYKFNSDAKFPVYRVKIVEKMISGDYIDNWIEIGFPRKDNKVGPKHSDFECIIDPFMTLTEAAFRRDFTINAGYYDVLEEKYHHLGYLNDIKTNTLKEVHSEKFKEDSLRILRGFQFISRFNLTNYNTVCHWILTSNPMMDELFNIDPSGIYAEFCKGITKANNIGHALDYLGYLAYGGCLFFDVINQMIHCDQNTKHHSEGNVWPHTKNVIKNAIELADKSNEQEKILLFWAAFFHDIGKMKTYALKDGQPTAYGHNMESDDLVEHYGARYGIPKKMIKQIIVLKHHHMIGNGAKNRKLFEIAEELNSVGLTFETLCKLMLADTYGSIKQTFWSTTRAHGETYAFIERLKALNIYQRKADMFVNGTDIEHISSGEIKGKCLGDLLKEMKVLQYAGSIKSRNEALDFLQRRCLNILEKRKEKVVDTKS